jgi:hypothetical protein
MLFKARLFNHINSLWLKNLYFMRTYGNNNSHVNLIYKQITKRLPHGSTVELWEEGYRIGHAIDAHYKATGFFELPNLSDFLIIEGDDRGYFEYLSSNINAWGVPISYHYLLSNPRSSFDKRLNLWGSTQSHKNYFKSLIEMILNYLKYSGSALPAGFVDVGCGDGSLLRALKEAVDEVFDKAFRFIGFDIDDQSSCIAKENGQQGILFLKGDVAKPEELNASLISKDLPSLDQFFQIRAFVDHNCKPFFEDVPTEGAPNTSDCCYLHNDSLVPKKFIEDSFSDHFARWKPFIHKQGLGIIELHKSEAYNLTESPAIAYEIFHLLSEQYIISYSTYAQSMGNAGLDLLDNKLVPNDIVYPNVSISIYR